MTKPLRRQSGLQPPSSRLSAAARVIRALIPSVGQGMKRPLLGPFVLVRAVGEKWRRRESNSPEASI